MFLKRVQRDSMVSLNNPYYIIRGTNIERRITLFREVNSRVRYYSLYLSMTLFGEYVLIRENGSVKNKKPTRVVKEYYKKEYEVILRYKEIVSEKFKRGYQVKKSNNTSLIRKIRDVQSR